MPAEEPEITLGRYIMINLRKSFHVWTVPNYVCETL